MVLEEGAQEKGEVLDEVLLLGGPVAVAVGEEQNSLVRAILPEGIPWEWQHLLQLLHGPCVHENILPLVVLLAMDPSWGRGVTHTQEGREGREGKVNLREDVKCWKKDV